MSGFLIPLLLIVLIGIMGAIGLLAWSMFNHIKKISKTPQAPWEPPLQAQIDKTQMLGEDLREFSEQMRERLSRENDKELAEYAKARRRHQAIPNPLPTLVDDGKVHQTNPKAEKILIPENLSETERAILKDFFNL